MQPDNNAMSNYNSVPAQSAQMAEPKKSGNPLLIILIVVVVLAIGLGVGLAVMIGQNNSANQRIEKLEKELEEAKKNVSEEKESNGGGTSSNMVETLQMTQRNVQRMDDMARVLTAVNSYQSNNNGKLPFTDGGVQDTFVRRYIDEECSTEDGLVYSDCSVQFRDPKGKNYGFAVPITVSDNMEDVLTDLNTMDYKFHVFINAACGSDDNTINKGVGSRQFALMMKLEGGTIACNDNH